MAKTTDAQTPAVDHIRFVYATKGEVASAPGADTVFHAHECQECASEFAIQASIETPFCPTCASSQVEVVENPERKIEQVTQANSDDLVAVRCGSSKCGAQLVFTSAHMHELQGTICCPVCATTNQFEYEQAAEEEASADDVKVGGEEQASESAEEARRKKAKPPVDDDEDEDDEEDASSDLEDIEDEEDLEDLPLEDIEDDESEEDASTEEEEDASTDDKSEEDASTEKKDETTASTEDKSKDAATASTEVKKDEEQQTASESDTKAGEQEQASETTEAKTEKGDEVKNEASTTQEEAKAAPADMTLRLLDAVEASAGKQQAISFNRAGQRILAHVNNITVAYLEEASVSEDRREAFKDQAFLKALANSTKAHGLRPTLDGFGFTLTEVKADAARFGALADERIQTTAAEIAAETANQVASEFANSLGIASVGINKNFWNGRDNPIRKALTAKLKDLGVRGADRVVAEAFADHGDAYHQLLIQTAQDLMSKPVEVRNGIAESIGGMNPTAKVVAGVEDDEQNNEFASVDMLDEESASTRLAQPFHVSRETATTLPARKGSHSTSVVETASAVRERFGSLFPKG